MSLRQTVACCGLAALLVGCFAKPSPVVHHRTYGGSTVFLHKVAVIPFYPAPRLGRAITGTNLSAAEVAELVASFMAEALAERGLAVIPANDVLIAFTGQGVVTPRQDAKAASELAAREFGADAVLLGQVFRFRERSGQALGSSRPASVAFEVVLHEAPSARRLWTSRFDHTQQPLTANVLNTPRYPGGGTRWLTAAELARWGAESMAAAVPGAP